MTIQVTVPDVGEASEVEVIEVLVTVGDIVRKDDSLVVLESDKASMEIPSPHAGKVVSIAVKEGDTVEEGSLIVELDVETGTAVDASAKNVKAAAETPSKSPSVEPPVPVTSSATTAKAKGPETSADISTEVPTEVPTTVPTEVPATTPDSSQSREQLVVVPDVGDAGEVTVTELLVKLGDVVAADDSILVLESDKASMEIPSPFAGEVVEMLVVDGSVVSEGDPLIKLRTTEQGLAPTARSGDEQAAVSVNAATAAEKVDEKIVKQAVEKVGEKAGEKVGEKAGEKAARHAAVVSAVEVVSDEKIHAGPAVRKQAREYGVNLAQLTGTGQKGRILKEDVQAFVKGQLQSRAGVQAQADIATIGNGIPPVPLIDFAKFGEIELRPLSRVRRSSARNLHRSWLNVAHVTQFDAADITDLEVFRKKQNQELASAGDKLTPLAFLIKACVHALIKYPQFNSSIDADYQHLTLKKYYNIGIAVETPDGLVVPVVRNADKKGVVELARESATLAGQARDKKLPLDAMQGATFTISSLGGIGGTAFTPIVNAPEVAILGVSRSSMEPVWDGQAFVPRLLLPLSLSYDHRAIDGAEAARFTHYLTELLGDMRRLIL
ncbi:dihydrolipoyllysine-residue acetyltransferase [Pseudomonadales bacterium]|nr:dihydrolipoyllysine-residue acetyltransferase [Pseudomonadales bacterium]